MISASQIGWGAYSSFSGPFYRGTMPYRLPSKPSLDDKILAVISATEGGTWNAVNMYDVCRLTLGLLQACEGSQYWCAALLGSIKHADSKLLEPLKPILDKAGASLLRNARNQWRFNLAKSGEVDTSAEQCVLFFNGSSGHKNEWEESDKLYAKEFAVACSSVLEQPAAIDVQKSWWVPKLRGFASGKLSEWITKANSASNQDIAQAFICASLSFAANNPRRAKNSFDAALDTAVAAPWTLDWLVHVLECMTFHPGVAIYPHRYNAIRPVLEKLFNIDLPDHSDKLSGLLSPSEAQTILKSLGYDLGPSGPNNDGVDGKWGKKSIAALRDFERRNGLSEDGMLDRASNEALKRARESLAPDTERTTIPSGPSPEFLLTKAVEQQIELLKKDQNV